MVPFTKLTEKPPMLGRWYHIEVPHGSVPLPIRYRMQSDTEVAGSPLRIDWQWSDGREPTTAEIRELDLIISEACFAHYQSSSGDIPGDRP